MRAGAPAWGSISQGLASEDHAGLLCLLYYRCSVPLQSMCALLLPRTGTGRRFLREAVNLSRRRLGLGWKLTLI